MTQSRPRNLAASVRQRLLNLSREKSEAFDLVLTRYALERLLCRIGRSEWRSRSLLKGAMLYTLWFDAPYRPTRDMDLLGFGPGGIEMNVGLFRGLAGNAMGDHSGAFTRLMIYAVKFDHESVS